MSSGSGEGDSIISAPWSRSAQEVLEVLAVDSERGLDASEVVSRRKKYGSNRLREHQTKSIWQILFNQVKSLIILLLAAAAAISFLYGEMLEGWAILIVILINSGIGFVTEWRAVRSMEALFKLGVVKTRVLRNGKVMEVDALNLVPGDIAVIEGGDVITADMRIIEASKMQADESTLTGESLPVEKQTGELSKETLLAERKNMLYKGTAVTRGSGLAVVVSTGLNTELGKISSLVDESEEEQTPLEDRLDRLGYRLIGLTLVIAFFVTLTGILRGKQIFLMIETGIALAVASIPEGLPIVATIALAKGLRVMAERNALINRLSSVETLGTTGVIFSDKTGTLTENRMTVTQFLLPDQLIKLNGKNEHSFAGTDKKPIRPGDDYSLRLILETGVLCNNATLSEPEEEKGTGDPLEVALLAAGYKADIKYDSLIERYPEVREEAFDPEVKMMATWNKVEEGKLRVSVKGAPGAVLKNCDREFVNGEAKALDENRKQEWLKLNEELASEGHRMLALALREADNKKSKPYENLILIGLVALLDPPRKDVRSAILKCKEAGIRVVMVTGDQKHTARFIAESVGLVEGEHVQVIHGSELPSPEELEASIGETNTVLQANIFARISPKQKLDLIELYQKRGHIVAMTGDGVNDAPALKKADIGIAMGKRGTQVAKEASDMVLTDDAFSTIVSAIEEGRVIFGNIRRFIFYLLSCNVSEVLIVGIATLLGSPLPLLPLQILFLNLVTDVFPALALGVGEGERGIMQQPPRKADESLLTNRHWMGIGIYGLIITVSVLGSLYIGLHYLQLDNTSAVTLSFLTLAFAQLWHVFNMRGPGSRIYDNIVVRNPWVWGALLLCVGIILGALNIPTIAEAMKLNAPDAKGWLVVLGMSLVPFILGQLYNGLTGSKQQKEKGSKIIKLKISNFAKERTYYEKLITPRPNCRN